MILRAFRRAFEGGGHGVRGLEGRNDAFEPAQAVEGVEGLFVGDGAVLGQALVVEVGVLGADAGVVEAGGDRVADGDLAVVVLQQVRLVAVEDTDLAAADAGRVFPARDAIPGRLAADELHARLADERCEDAHGVAAAADAGEDLVRQPPLLFANLLAGLLALMAPALFLWNKGWRRA